MKYRFLYFYYVPKLLDQTSEFLLDEVKLGDYRNQETVNQIYLFLQFSKLLVVWLLTLLLIMCI